MTNGLPSKGVKRDTPDGQNEELHVTFSDDNADNNSPEDKSASAAFRRNATNQHLDNPNKKSRKQGALHVVSYKILKTVATPVATPMDYGIQCRAEIDSRADTICCGKTFWMTEEQTEQIADVTGFHDDLGILKEIPITTCCTAINHPQLQETLILVCHESLYFGNGMEDSLISLNQLGAHGLVVDTCPKQFLGGQSMHDIYVPDKDLFLPF
jgi:hypothetical protein